MCVPQIPIGRSLDDATSVWSTTTARLLLRCFVAMACADFLLVVLASRG